MSEQPTFSKTLVAPTGARRTARFVSRGTLVLWGMLSAIVCSYLLGAHLLTLPSPTRDDAKLAAKFAETRSPEENGKWRVAHVLYAKCGCSRKVLEHLMSRGAIATLSERIDFVADHESPETLALAKRAADAGFRFELVPSGRLEARYDTEAVPLMVVADGTNKLRYVGGYTDRKQGAVLHDLEIIERLERGDSVRPLPVFGCPVSESLRRDVDPLRLR